MADNGQPDNNGKNNKNFFNQNPILVFILFSLVTIMAFKTFVPSDDMNANGNLTAYGQTQNKQVAYSDLKTLIKNGQIEYVGIGNTTIKAVSKPTGGAQTVYRTRKVVPDDTLIPLLEQQNINYGGINEENVFADMLFGWVLPILIFFGIWMFLANRMQKSMGGGGGGLLGIGGAKKMINSEKPNVKFDDMAGNKEAKEEVTEVVDFLREPDR